MAPHMLRGAILSICPRTGAIIWLIRVIKVSKVALIVDDSRSARVVLKRVLETHDLDVDTAESAEDALDYLINHRPNVIFMDHLMPGMDGFEAVSAIKRNPETATIPIMMYTSQKGEVYVGQARALGAVGVLPKKVAPVEVSKVLKSLHIIGDEKQKQSGEQVPPTSETSGETVALKTLSQDLRIIIQDLFDQQRAILRRDLLDSYETIATQVVDEIRPPLPAESDELPLSNEGASSKHLRAVVVVLAVLTIIFAWLYWQREQSWQDMQAQTTELQQAFESQRISNAEDSLQVLRNQQSLDAMYAATISSLEWGANQASEYHFGELPLGDDRLKIVEQLTDQLLAIGFSGVIRIESHVADYCLTLTGSDDYAPAKDLMVADCDTIGVALGEAYEMGLGQSDTFANFIRLADERTSGRIRYEIISQGNSDPLVDYPATINDVSAIAWNRIAAANNRVEISVYADSK